MARAPHSGLAGWELPEGHLLSLQEPVLKGSWGLREWKHLPKSHCRIAGLRPCDSARGGPRVGPSVTASRSLLWGGEYWGPVGSTYTDPLSGLRSWEGHC